MSLFLLQISLGTYFGVLGVNDLAQYASRGAQVFSLFNNSILNLAIAIILLLAGIFLVASLFAPIGGRLAGFLYIMVMIVWTLIIIMTLMLGNLFKPNMFSWLAELARHIVILSGTWIVSRKTL